MSTVETAGTCTAILDELAADLAQPEGAAR